MMRKLFVWFAPILGILFFASCEKKIREQPMAETLIGTWRTTHQYFSLKLEEAAPEAIKKELEHEISVSVTERESYQLTFEKNGKGQGSGVRHDGEGRYNFNFIWELSDGMISITATEPGYGGVFFNNDWTPVDKLFWNIEEYTSDKMVLGQLIWRQVSDGNQPWGEFHTYRYTFEKVK